MALPLPAAGIRRIAPCLLAAGLVAVGSGRAQADLPAVAAAAVAGGAPVPAMAAIGVHSATASAMDATGPGRGADRVTPPAGPSGFDAPDDPSDISQVARLALVSDVSRIRPGETFRLAVTMSMARHWHTYWINPGDTGVPARLSVRAPEGFTVGAPQYPRPEVITGPEGTTYGYDEEAWIFVPVTAPRTLDPDAAPAAFEVDLMYLVCREMCLIGSGTLNLSIPIASATAGAGGDPSASTARPIPADERTMAAMRPWLARVPGMLRDLAGASMQVDLERATLHLRIPIPATDVAGATGAPGILPAPGSGVQFGAPSIRRDGQIWDVRVPLQLSPGNTLGQPYLVRGLVTFGETPDAPAWHFEQSFPVPAVGG